MVSPAIGLPTSEVLLNTDFATASDGAFTTPENWSTSAGRTVLQESCYYCDYRGRIQGNSGCYIYQNSVTDAVSNGMQVSNTIYLKPVRISSFKLQLVFYDNSTTRSSVWWYLTFDTGITCYSPFFTTDQLRSPFLRLFRNDFYFKDSNLEQK